MRPTVLVAIVALACCLAQVAPAQQGQAKNQTGAFGDSEYRLGPEDVIQVFVWKEAELSTTVVVRPDGKVSLPLIGEMLANGKTAMQLQLEVAKKLTEFLANPPVVNIIVKEVNNTKVTVLGEVKTPGMHKIKDRATILDAIALAGGFTEYAKRDKVTVIRQMPSGEQKRYVQNVEDVLKRPDENLFYIFPNDKIYVQ
jgi:polysaccharide biosynthesis/export protein